MKLSDLNPDKLPYPPKTWRDRFGYCIVAPFVAAFLVAVMAFVFVIAPLIAP